MSTTVFTNGSVLTPEGVLTADVAVAGGIVAAVGHEATAVEGTRVDLDGGLLLPGFRDGHVHPLWGGIDLARLPLETCDDPDEIGARLGDYAAAHPELEWIIGGPYRAEVLPGGIGDARWLDRVVPDRPVMLSANDYHTVWVNSRALELAGIDASTPDPALGQIHRRADGTPSGMLVEWGAIDMVERLQPKAGTAERDHGLELGMAHLAAHGLVWLQEAAATADDGSTYLAAARAGRLPLRVNVAWRADPETWVRDLETFAALRAEIAGEEACDGRLTAHTVKFFADGVIEHGTGMVLEPYEDEPHSCGLPNWTPEALAEAVARVDALGFQTHVHAIGDGGIRMALDAIEHAATRNDRRDRRPVIAHTQLVHPDDRPRFARLGVIANFEPLWAQLDGAMTELTIPRLGPERSALQYPIGSLHRLGARISFGSDWPVSSAAPLEGLAVAVTRQTRSGEPLDGWLPEERVPVATALAAYTAGSAHQAYDDDRGTIAVGAPADFTLVAADITAIAGGEVADVAVTGTWVDGVEVFRA